MKIRLLFATSASLAVRGAQIAATQGGYPAACPRGSCHDCFDCSCHLKFPFLSQGSEVPTCIA
eukprot:3503179-Pyramimonas_sp.AAC.1